MILLASDNKLVTNQVEKKLSSENKEFVSCTKSIDFIDQISQNSDKIDIIVADSSLIRRSLVILKYLKLIDVLKNKPIVEIISSNDQKKERLNNMSIELNLDEVDSQLVVMIDDIIRYN